MTIEIMAATNSVSTGETIHSITTRRKAFQRKAANHTGGRTRRMAIEQHPYAKKSPGFAQALLSSKDTSLTTAMDALDEAQARSQGKSVCSSDSTKTAFQLQQERLDSRHGTIAQAQARSEGAPSQTQLQSNKSAFQQQQELLNRSHGPIDAGVGP